MSSLRPISTTDRVFSGPTGDRRARRGFWTVLVLTAIATLGYVLYHPRSPDGEVFKTATVAPGPVERIVSAGGKIRALTTVRVGAEVSGQIAEIHADFNSAVRAGQLLAVIDPTRPSARVQEITGQVQAAKAALAQAQAAVAGAEADLVLQRRDLSRRRALAASRFVATSQVEASEGAVAKTEATLGGALAQVQAAHAQIMGKQAELVAARVDLARTRILAPIDGIIVNRLAEKGATVAASFQTPDLFEIAADTRRMQVDALVDEADIGEVREGQTARLRVSSYPEGVFHAKVSQVRKAATETQGVVSYVVVVDVDNPRGELLPGMSASVDIVTGRSLDSLRVPSMALRFRPRLSGLPQTPITDKQTPVGVPVVWVLSSFRETPEPRRVRIGLVGEDFTVVQAGVRPGERVIIGSKIAFQRSDGR